MNATCEISLYPLSEDYEAIVTDFCKDLMSVEGIDVEVNGVSTQIFGPYDLVWESMGNACRKVFESKKAIAVMKWAGKDLRPENLPEELKK
jgi:uncharacterized protein YqgV (UPF0045/DUF77 family)